MHERESACDWGTCLLRCMHPAHANGCGSASDCPPPGVQTGRPSRDMRANPRGMKAARIGRSTCTQTAKWEMEGQLREGQTSTTH